MNVTSHWCVLQPLDLPTRREPHKLSPGNMMQRNKHALRWGIIFLVLLVQAEAIQLSSVLAQAKMGVRREKRKMLIERLENSEATSFAEMSESLQSEVAMHQLQLVREAAYGMANPQTALKEVEEFGNIPSPVGKSKYGTPRDYSKERFDSKDAKRVCHCMASELLYGMTRGTLPYRKNYRGKCYEFDVGAKVTPLWYKKVGKSWYWTPWKPSTKESHHDVDEWMRTNTFTVNKGLTWLLQKAGVTDVADENKFLIRLLNDFKPAQRSSAPSGSKSNALSAKYDLELCRKRQGVPNGARFCAVKKSGCLKNIVTRYFQFVDVQARAVATRKDRGRWALDAVSFGLDLLGMTEPFGFLFDLFNAGLAFARKHHLEGVLSVLSAIPGLGQHFTVLKWIIKSSKGLARAVKWLFKHAIALFESLGRYAMKGFRASRGWFRKTALSLKYVTKTVRGSMKLRKAMKKLLMDHINMLPKSGTTGFKKVIADYLKKFMALMEKTIAKSFDMMCKTRTVKKLKPHKLLDGTGKVMEYTGVPWIKESGEWLQAVSPCLAFRCSANVDIEEYYNCGLHVGFETFKKAMAKTNPDLLEAMGEYDPFMFSNVADELKSPPSRVLLEKDLSDQTCKVNLDADKYVDSKGFMKGIPPYVSRRGKSRLHKTPTKIGQSERAQRKSSENKQSDSVSGSEHGGCDNRRWYKVQTAKHGLCEDFTSKSSCSDGVFLKNYCRNRPDNVRCCVRVKCLEGAGVCTKSKNCGRGHKFLSGHCPGPSSVKCCVPEK